MCIRERHTQSPNSMSDQQSIYFTDGAGRRWRLAPDTRNPNALAFIAEDTYEVRRLYEAPADWTKLDAAGLRRLLKMTVDAATEEW